MKDFSQLIVVAILVEAIWENIKMIYQDKKFSISIGCILVAPLRYNPLIAINIERSNLVEKSVRMKEYFNHF